MSFKLVRHGKRPIPPVSERIKGFPKEFIKVVTTAAKRAARRNALVISGDMRKSIGMRISDNGETGVVFSTDPGAPTQEFSPRGFSFFRPAAKTAQKRIKKEIKKFLAELDKKTESTSGS